MSELLRKWLVRHNVDDDIRGFAYTLPAAGAGAATHRALADIAPAGLSTCTVRLPGRETRLTEPPFRRMTDLVGAVGAQLSAHVRGHHLPFLLVGECAGAHVAYELGRYLGDRGQPPAALVAIAQPGPAAGSRGEMVHTLPSDAFRRTLSLDGMLADEVAADDDLFAMFEPTLRADWELAETYEWISKGLPSFPVSALVRSLDGTTLELLRSSWQGATRGRTVMLTSSMDGEMDESTLLSSELSRLLTDLTSHGGEAR